MSWQTTCIGEHVKKISTWNPTQSSASGTFRYIDLSSVDKNQKVISIENVLEINQVDAPSRARQLVQVDDVLVSTVRPNLNGVAIVPNELDGATASTGYCVLRANERSLYSRYLYHWIKTDSFVADMVKKATGANYPAVSDKIIKESEIPLPPLTEQKRIAAILDKADSLRRKNQQAIQLADRFLRAVFLDMFGDPVTNPKGWKVQKLRDIALIQIGPFGTQLHKEDYVEGGIPLVNPTHIVEGKILPNYSLTVTANKHADLAEYHLRIGDIILGRRGEMGRCAVISQIEENWLCGTGSLFIRPQQTGVFSEYLCKLLSGKAIKRYLEAESQGATMANLNKTIVGNMDVPIPNSDALAKLSVLQEKVLVSLQKHILSGEQSLFNALSQKAFAGKL